MSQRPPARKLTDAEFSDLIGAQQFGTLATVRASGHPHLTTVGYLWDPEARTVRVSTTLDRAKPGHLRRDPRAALHVNGGNVWSFAVAEGRARVSEPSTGPGDAVGLELLQIVSAFAKPEDDAAFLRLQVAERRVVVTLRADRLYGTALDLG